MRDDSDTRLALMAAEQKRLEMRMDELAQGLLDMKSRFDRVEAAQASLTAQAAQRKSRPPKLEVVKIEPAKPVEEAAPVEEKVKPTGVRSKAAAPATPVEKSSAPVIAPPKARTNDGEAVKAYSGAFNAYRKGSYAKAILDFEDFVGKYPEHQYADSAQFWIGESYFSQGEFAQAIVEFNKVVERYPRKQRAADAYFMIGKSYEGLKQPDRARSFYGRLVELYPSSEAAFKAKKLMATPKK